jgi:hypothetical protein
LAQRLVRRDSPYSNFGLCFQSQATCLIKEGSMTAERLSIAQYESILRAENERSRTASRNVHLFEAQRAYLRAHGESSLENERLRKIDVLPRKSKCCRVENASEEASAGC